MEDDDDVAFDVNVGLRIERHMGEGAGANYGVGARVGDLVVGGPSAKVGGHGVDDGSEYEKSKFLHSAHDSD